jgi:hypothetical protein
MHTVKNIEELKNLVGQKLRTRKWIKISQERNNKFPDEAKGLPIWQAFSSFDSQNFCELNLQPLLTNFLIVP